MSDEEHTEGVNALGSRHPSRFTSRCSRAFGLVCNVLPEALIILVMGALKPGGRGVTPAEEAA